MEIRYINKSDNRFSISRIYEESWKYAYSGIIPQEYLDSIPKGRWADKVTTPGWSTMVCIENGRFIGTSSFCKSRFPEYGDVGEVISLYLLPDYIGQGYGSRLLWAVLNELKKAGYQEAFLWVLEENKNAIRFYEKNGFIPSGDHHYINIGGRNLREIRLIRRFIKYYDYIIANNSFRVFYYYDYVPKNKEYLVKSEFDKLIRDKIWNYKKVGDDVDENVLQLTEVLHQELNELSTLLKASEHFRNHEKYLIAVPTSNYERKSTIAKSIEIICQKDSSYVDKCNLIYRKKDLKPQHYGGNRYSLEELEDSLDCLYDNLDKVHDSVIFLIDDIVTLGKSLMSCANTLVNHGVRRNKICYVTLARTRSEND